MSHPHSASLQMSRCQLICKHRIRENNKFYQRSHSDCKNKRWVCIGKGFPRSVNIKEDKIICVLCEAAVVLVGKEAKTAVRWFSKEYWQRHTNKSTSSEGLSWTAQTPTITSAAAVKETSDLQQLNIFKQKDTFVAQLYLQCLKK